MRIQFSVSQKQELHGDFILEIGSAACDQVMNVVVFHFRDHRKAVFFIKLAQLSAQRIFLKFQQLFFGKLPLPFLFLKIGSVELLGFVVDEQKKLYTYFFHSRYLKIRGNRKNPNICIYYSYWNIDKHY